MKLKKNVVTDICQKIFTDRLCLAYFGPRQYSEYFYKIMIYICKEGKIVT